jgi:hypothetical protein
MMDDRSTGAPATSGPKYRYEIVALFNSASALESAIGALTNAGWDRSEMSLLGSKEQLAPFRSTRDVADDPDAERAPVTSQADKRTAGVLAGGLGGVVAAFLASGATIMSGGTALAAVIGGAVAAGAGGAGGDILGRALSRQMSKPLEEQIARGGIVLWVLLRSRDREPEARAIVERYGAQDVHLNEREGVSG